MMKYITVEIVLIGAGIIFIFFGIVGYVILPKVGLGPKLTKRAQIFLVLVGIVFLIIGLLKPVGISSPIPGLSTSPRVKPEATPSPSPSTFIPVNVPDLFIPSGWMGDWGDISFNDSWTENPHSSPTCIRITYSAVRSQGEGWAGIYWQYPDKNWGGNPDGRNLTGAKKLTFWARGQKGGEKAEFKVGGISGKYPDSIQPPVSTGVIVLSDKWQQYIIDLKGKDLSHIIGGFVWVTSKSQNPNGSTIYLDDIRYD
jgi:hypothetical protein